MGRVIARLVLTANVWAIAQSAVAGALGTEWGMTVEEARSTIGGAETNADRSKDDGTDRAELTSTYFLEGTALASFYRFDTMQVPPVLVGVLLIGETNTDCKLLTETLKTTYGRPEEGEDNEFFERLTWRDPERRNHIVFGLVKRVPDKKEDFCLLEYNPLPKPGIPGGF